MGDDVPSFGQIFLCLAEPEVDVLEVDFSRRHIADGFQLSLGPVETKGEIRNDQLGGKF